jgi:hypothetical protein
MSGLLAADQQPPSSPTPVARLLRGQASSRFLERLGINAKQFWLLADLFGALSERREFMGNLGRDKATLRTLAIVYAGFMGLMSLALASAQLPPLAYLSVFLGMTVLLLFSIVLSEISDTLVNPVEALILAHQPINGATYAAAKLGHILRILLYLIPGLNAIPAFAGLILKTAGWSYPLLHLAVASAAGLLIALSCCGLFGWLIRIVPAARLNTAARTAEFLPSLGFFFYAYGRRLIGTVHPPLWLIANRPLQIALAVLVVGLAVSGVRCLTIDYLVRVTSIVHAGSAAKGSHRRRLAFMGTLVSRFLGGQAARAGFEFVRRLMARDWQFRRQLMAMAPSLVMLAALAAGGSKTSPFSGRFTTAHLLPHFFGFVLLGLCGALPYGSDYKALWVFLLIPPGVFRRFGAGAAAALWIIFIVVPHLILFPILALPWGFGDAAIFVSYSLAMASLYLAFELRLIDGVPFGKQLQSNRAYFAFGIFVLFMMSAGIWTAIQYLLLFRSQWTAAAAALVLGAAAWLAARRSLGAFETAMRHGLGVLSSESTLLYHEIQ